MRGVKEREKKQKKYGFRVMTVESDCYNTNLIIYGMTRFIAVLPCTSPV
jgi:hypothetical protein